MPHVPAMVGVPVGNGEVSERFLWDVRRALAGMIAGTSCMSDILANWRTRTGCGLFSVEAYGDGNFDNLQCSAPSGHRRWPNSGPAARSRRNEASHAAWSRAPARPAGRRRRSRSPPIQILENGRTLPPPSSRSGTPRLVLASSRFVFHRWAMQPWAEPAGRAWRSARTGIHFERTETWFEQSRAWAHLPGALPVSPPAGNVRGQTFSPPARRAGTPVASPDRRSRTRFARGGATDDGCSAEHAREDEREQWAAAFLPAGMSYRLLVLPESRCSMTPQASAKNP